MATSRSSPAGVASLRKDAARGVGEPELPFRRVLIANRGEIAVRIIRACHELGIEAIAIYSDADAQALHTRLADVAIRIGPPAPAESYLRIDADRRRGAGHRRRCRPPRLRVPRRAGSVRACGRGGGTRVRRPVAGRDRRARGQAACPPARPLGGRPGRPGHARAGSRRAPRPGRRDRCRGGARSASRCWSRQRPAAADAGCAGSRRPRSCPPPSQPASAEATSAFGDGAVYLEREILPARHIEVQLLGDASGRVVAIGERDCSIQRRHQKLVEEAPAPGLTVARSAGAARHGGPPRRGGRPAQRGHGRVPARTGRRLRLPRGQHAPPGRARRDRAGHRPGPRPGAAPAGCRTAAVRGRAGRRRASRGARRSRDRGPHRGREPGRQLHPDAGPDHAVDDAGRAGGPGGQWGRSGRSGRAGVRQPDREADGPRRGPGCRDRPPPPCARRDRDRGRPDDPAVPSLRRPGRELPGRCRLHRVGGRALRRTGGAPARPPSGQARGGPGGRRGARQPTARANPGRSIRVREDGRWRAAGRADAMDRWPA